MEIALNDLKVALSRAYASGFGDVDTDSMAAFAFGYLSAGPLENEPAEAAPRWHVGDKIAGERDLGEMPEGSQVRDADGDYYVKFSGGWAWHLWSTGTTRLEPDEYQDSTETLLAYLPATIVKVGA